jgi:hypothetical protein
LVRWTASHPKIQTRPIQAENLLNTKLSAFFFVQPCPTEAIERVYVKKVGEEAKLLSLCQIIYHRG